MGGTGSGRTTVRSAVEDRTCLSISAMLQAGELTGVDPANPFIYLRDFDLSITLESTSLYFGGTRLWFICPACSSRCANLYLCSSKFYCRLCLNLTYRSSQESHRYDTLNALIASRMTRKTTGQEVGRYLTKAARMHRRPWIRKRDRRANYKSRWKCPMHPFCEHS